LLPLILQATSTTTRWRHSSAVCRKQRDMPSHQPWLHAKSQIPLRYPGRRQVRGWSQTCQRARYGVIGQITARCRSATRIALWNLASNRSATGFEQVRAISTCQDSSNLAADRFAAGLSQIPLRYPGRRQVRGWSQTCRRPASSC